MLCPSCNSFRPATNAPCPFCQAPSPLVSNPQGGGPGVAGNDWNHPAEQAPFPATFWQDPPGGTGQQLPFPQAPQTGNLWMQVMSPSTDQQNALPTGQQSLLPVPYQEQQRPFAPNSLMMLPGGFPTINQGAQGANPLLPALPDEENAPVYVAPMYTKPRPIIPRYRAISGLISFILVGLLLCGGAGYYAQATGKLVFIQKMFGNYSPPKISSAQNMLKVPSTQITPGPANNIITSTAISNKTDQNYQVPSYVNQFTVGETIYIVCSVNTTQAGMILVKLYTNNNLYATLPQAVAANDAVTTRFMEVYTQPAEGKAEVYWADPKGKNAQLAATMLFVVEPQA